MGRSIRYIPPGGSLVEVTCRTVQGRFLLRPSRELNQVIVGLLARACKRYPVDLVAAVFLSNHYHLLLWTQDAGRLASFMNYLNGNLAREASRLHAWQGPFWAHRYRAIVVSEEEQAQIDRLRYLLAHGAKEGLVPRPTDWPGVHCAESITTGRPLHGAWFDRTAEGRARRNGRTQHRNSHVEPAILRFAKLPCWQHLDDGHYRRRVVEILAQIEETTGSNHKLKACLTAIRRQHPHDAPRTWQPRPAPRFHAFRTDHREALQQAYRAFLAAFRQATDRLRAGREEPHFPAGCFPPARRFVAAQVPRAP